MNHQTNLQSELPGRALSIQADATFRHLIRNSFDMIVLIDAQGIQRYVSDSCEKILGFKPEELIGLPVIETMIHPDDREKTLSGLKGILEQHTFGGTQYRHRHKNGDWVYLEAFGTNQIDNPDIGFVVLNVRDITKRKKAEEALRESESQLKELNATKDKFFSIIGHDIKNPFNNIIGLSDLLLEYVKMNDLEGTEEYAKMIRHSSKQALDLLSNLLFWARSQTGKLAFNPESVDCSAMIDNVIELFSDSASFKDITLKYQCNKPGIINADRQMLHLMLRNLLSNAIKFTQNGGIISFSTDTQDRYLSISVSDNGVGISKENLNKLFLADKIYTTKGTNMETGTGLGLTLCRDFAEMHGGTMSAQSEPGIGTTFTLLLPME